MATNSKEMTVGVIDVGSNTIKLLIAKAGGNVPAVKVDFIVEETRIGEGMTGHPPVIGAEAIARGAAAIARLAKAAEACDALSIVATSAVRDAANRQDFVTAIETACGHKPKILSGDEEAALIGLALTCDPAITKLNSYSLLDLGGGSLECIQFENRKITRAQSFQLGSIRLASLLVQDRVAPLPQVDQTMISQHVRAVWENSRFPSRSCPSQIAVLTGGAAKHLALTLSEEQLENGIELQAFSEIATHLCSLQLKDRVLAYDIPESRADIFPTAMVTLEASLRHLGCKRLYFSEYNLRFGVATELLQAFGVAKH